MKYTIITIDESRAIKKQAIRENVPEHWEEIKDIQFLNGRIRENVTAFLEQNSYLPKVTYVSGGEWGIWGSQMNCWKWAVENGPLVMFEDDAMLSQTFGNVSEWWFNHLPEDWELFALFVPENQMQDFYHKVTFDENGTPTYESGKHRLGNPIFLENDVIAKAYQGYSCVALAVSAAGGQKLLDLTKERGIHGPVDCFIFEMARAGKLKAYAPKPPFSNVVTIDWNAPTTIHDTEMYVP